MFALLAAGARAEGPRITYVDALTGIGISHPATATRPGRSMVVSHPAYSPMEVDVPDGARDIYVELQPAQLPPELEPANLERIHAAGKVFICGYIVDATTLQPMSDVDVSTGDLHTRSDARGFFFVNASPDEAVEVTFRRDGYETQTHEQLDRATGGEWIYRIALETGSGSSRQEHGNPRGREARPSMTITDFAIAPNAGCSVPAPNTSFVASKIRIPRSIRVDFGGGSITYVPFDTYCGRVLSAEWLYSGAESLPNAAEGYRAGAVAIRTYAISFMNNDSGHTYHDICATTSCQVYNTALYTTAANAVAATSGTIVVNSSDKITLRMTEYSAEQNNAAMGGETPCGDGWVGTNGKCVQDPVCTGKAPDGHGHGMCQNGTLRWATGYYNLLSSYVPTGCPTQDWKWIVAHYYPDYRLGSATQLQVGDGVRVFGTSGLGLVVHSSASLSSGCPQTGACKQYDGASGTIIAGPSTADNYTWWQIDWADGTRGWSVENYLEHGPAQPTCSFSRTPSSATGAGTGGTGSIQVTGSPSGCAGSWSATSNSFVTLTGTASGSGPSTWTVPYSYSQNPSSTSTRQGTVTFNGSFPGGSTFTLTQDPGPSTGCTYSISPQSATGAGAGGTGTIQVSGSPNGCTGNWSATSNSFVTLTGTASGNGASTWSVPYSYSQNPSSTSTRQGTVTFNGTFPGGSTFTLTQDPSALPNLTPFKPNGWADKLVVSRVAGTSTDDILTSNDSLYVDWAVLNNGAGSAPSGFRIDLLLDGTLVAYWQTGSTLDPNYYFAYADWTHAPLSAGTHTITIVADSQGNVSESNEADNTYTKTIQVRGNLAHTRGDFNGDGRADIGVFRPSTGVWYSQVLYPTTFGQSGDIPVPGDYDGDGRADIAVFRPSTGMWYSTVFYPTQYGVNGDIPVPADYDGDGDDDIAVFRPSTGMWYSTVFYPTQWGQNGDVPVPADYNGDGRAEIAVFRPSSGMWYSALFYPTQWGQNGDVPVAADYNGDGHDDIAVFRPSTGMWYSSVFYPTLWGQNGDVPVPADYDGDGDDDIAVFRPSTGVWYSAIFNPTTWGQSGDIPLTRR